MKSDLILAVIGMALAMAIILENWDSWFSSGYSAILFPILCMVSSLWGREVYINNGKQ